VERLALTDEAQVGRAPPPGGFGPEVQEPLHHDPNNDSDQTDDRRQPPGRVAHDCRSCHRYRLRWYPRTPESWYTWTTKTWGSRGRAHRHADEGQLRPEPVRRRDRPDRLLGRLVPSVPAFRAGPRAGRQPAPGHAPRQGGHRVAAGALGDLQSPVGPD